MKNEQEQKDLKRWVEAWERAGKAMQEIKRQEMQDPDFWQKNWQLLDEMLQYAVDHAEPRQTSGLAEQQKWFMKYRQQLIARGELEE